MSHAREGLGELQSESDRVPAPRINPAHTDKAMQSRMKCRMGFKELSNGDEYIFRSYVLCKVISLSALR